MATPTYPFVYLNEIQASVQTVKTSSQDRAKNLNALRQINGELKLSLQVMKKKTKYAESNLNKVEENLLTVQKENETLVEHIEREAKSSTLIEAKMVSASNDVDRLTKENKDLKLEYNKEKSFR